MVDEEVPLAPGCVYGFRVWWADDEGRLQSVVHSGKPWSAGENVARCAQARIIAPIRPVKPTPPTEAPPPLTTDFFRPTRAAVVPQFCPESPRRHPATTPGAPIKQPMAQVLTEKSGRDRQAHYEKQMESYSAALVQWERETELFLRERATHIAPVEDCECGFYMVKDHRVATQYSYGSTAFFGVVQGYGRTVPMRKGFKTEKVRIVALAPYSESTVRGGPMYQIARSFEHLLLYGESDSYVPEVTVVQREVHVDELVRENYPEVERFADLDAVLAAWGERVAAS